MIKITTPKAIQDYQNICFKCLKKDNITKFTIYGRGYGSAFDNINTYLQLCDKCKQLVKQEWFDEEPKLIDEFIEEYQYEDNILNFIKTLPLEGQELFYNRCANGAGASYYMEPQDWIDYYLGILPHEKCKEYGLYSLEEKKAYKERFATCEHPINIIYDDGSKGCWCVFGAHGDYGQKISSNISDECYSCQYYKPRTNPIKEMSYDEFQIYKKYFLGKLNYLKYKNKFE
jgi:hypothetical protein